MHFSDIHNYTTDMYKKGIKCTLYCIIKYIIQCDHSVIHIIHVIQSCAFFIHITIPDMYKKGIKCILYCIIKYIIQCDHIVLHTLYMLYTVMCIFQTYIIIPQTCIIKYKN